jgi:cytochrome c-type biogenesis protein CcmH/NrfF
VIPTLKLTLGLAPYVLTVAGWAITRLRDRRTLRRSPELQRAINRHPSVTARKAMYRLDCGQTVFGVDPLDLVARQMTHELNCLECIKESAA